MIANLNSIVNMVKEIEVKTDEYESNNVSYVIVAMESEDNRLNHRIVKSICGDECELILLLFSVIYSMFDIDIEHLPEIADNLKHNFITYCLLRLNKEKEG